MTAATPEVLLGIVDKLAAILAEKPEPAVVSIVETLSGIVEKLVPLDTGSPGPSTSPGFVTFVIGPLRKQTEVQP